MAVSWSPAATSCVCGKRKTVHAVIEYVKSDGTEGYAGGRVCYDHGTQVSFAIPEGAVLTELRLFDWRSPDEMIVVSARPLPDREPAP